MTQTAPSGLLAVPEMEHAEIELSESLTWLRQRIDKFVVGACTSLQDNRASASLVYQLRSRWYWGRRGVKTLYVLTEQSQDDLAKVARQMTSDWPRKEAEKAMSNVLPEDSVYDIETLPSFLGHQVMSPSGKYHDVKLIVVDSVQGHGLSATATRKYKQLYEFCRQCKTAGITVILVAACDKERRRGRAKGHGT